MKHPDFLGIVDVGSNTFNFLLAKTDGEHTKVLHQDRSPVMLGKGSHETKRIQPEAEQRAQQALLDFKAMAAHVGPIQWKGVATAALRYAQNGAEVAERLFQQTGIPIHIISGEQEAEFIFKGVQTHLNFGQQNGLIMDVGGPRPSLLHSVHRGWQDFGVSPSEPLDCKKYWPWPTPCFQNKSHQPMPGWKSKLLQCAIFFNTISRNFWWAAAVFSIHWCKWNPIGNMAMELNRTAAIRWPIQVLSTGQIG